MDFRLAEDQRALQDAARRFARGELETLARKLKARHEPVPDDCLWRYAEMDFLDISVATQYSDLGPGNLEALIVIEEFAQVSATVAFLVFESSAGPVRAIEHFAPESLRQRVIPRVCRGELAVAVAMSEPDAGSALTDLRTTARADGDSVLVNGLNRWYSGGRHSGGHVVYARLSDAPGAAGIGAVYVEKTMAGVSFGAGETLRAFRGIPSADIFLDRVRVPLDNVIVPTSGCRAAPNAEQGLPSMLESSLAKCFANQMVREVCGHGVQLMGAYGYSGSIRWSSACGMDGLCIPGGASISRRRTSPRPWSGVASINAVENTVPHCPGPLERLLDIPGFLESGREGRHGF